MKSMVITVYLPYGKEVIFTNPKTFSMEDGRLLWVEAHDGEDYIFPYTSISYYTMKELKKNED